MNPSYSCGTSGCYSHWVGAAIVIKLEGVSATPVIPKGQTSGTTVLVAPKAAKPINVKISADYDDVTKVAKLSIAP